MVISVLAHPDGDSFCAALHHAFATEWEGGAPPPQLLSLDLYRDKFNPVMSLPELQRHLPIDKPASAWLSALQNCRELLLFFPDWWGAEPAILKGFFDRLFRQGIAYDRADAVMGKGAKTRGLLSNCRLKLWICSDSSGEQLQTCREHYERRFRFLADYCSMQQLELKLCSPLRGSSLRQRQTWLAECRETARNIISTT